MALGLSTGGGAGGDFNAIVKFDARAGRMFRVDRTQGPAGWETGNVEITNGFKAIFDMENIQVGWALFAAGIQPAFAMAPLGQPMPTQPNTDYKQGFKVMLKLGKSSGGDVREFVSTAKAVIGALDTLHEAYEAGKAENPGKLPVVAMTGSVPIVSTGKGQSSTNYAPTFEIVQWVDRPEDLPAAATPSNVTPLPTRAEAPAAAPVAQMRTTAQAAPAEDVEEF